MTYKDIASYRLLNHQITHSGFSKPKEVVAWLGAVQSQDYISSKWVVGIRTPKSTELSIEKAVNEGKIIRTWAMRGTLHLIAAPDVKWLIELIGPGILSRLKSKMLKMGLDEASLKKSLKIFSTVMKDGNHSSRQSLFEALENQGISMDAERGQHFLYHASFKGLICSGPLNGKQNTYTLLDEWVAKPKSFNREEAIGELAMRYFQSHGPATINDFSWWSGLSLTEARLGLEMINSKLSNVNVEGQTYWMSNILSNTNLKPSSGYLLAGFDEYFLGYKDRSLVLEEKYFKHAITNNGIFFPTVIIDGLVMATWKRTIKKETVQIEINPIKPITKAQKESISSAADRFGTFIDKTPEVKYV